MKRIETLVSHHISSYLIHRLLKFAFFPSLHIRDPAKIRSFPSDARPWGKLGSLVPKLNAGFSSSQHRVSTWTSLLNLDDKAIYPVMSIQICYSMHRNPKWLVRNHLPTIKVWEFPCSFERVSCCYNWDAFALHLLFEAGFRLMALFSAWSLHLLPRYEGQSFRSLPGTAQLRKRLLNHLESH